MLGAIAFFSSITWYPDDLLYQMLAPISRHRLEFLFLSWLVGAVIIFILSWKKTLQYVDLIAGVSEELVRQDDKIISLPPELKKVEERMNQIKQQAARNARLAKEAEQRKSDLIIYLAHDLKTPLTSVIGYLTLLQEEKEISPELQEKYLSISLEKAERLEDLINEFFEITRFNLTHLTLEVSQVDLSRMLEQIAYEFRPVLAQKNLDYQLVLDPEVKLQCDVDKLERVFDNLIRNAVNYSFPDSEIAIILKEYEEGVTVQVSNRGNTIPPEKLSRIFEQFFRLDSSRSTGTGGAGLGLAIAKEIVELHRGKISAESSDQNIRFTIWLPKKQEGTAL